MSSYATLAQLKTHVGASVDPPGVYDQFTDLVNSVTADDAVGQQRVDDAEGFINGKLGARYRTPIDVSVDAALAQTMRSCTLAIAAWNLYMQHPAKPRVRRVTELEYQRWSTWLDQVAAGGAALPGGTEIPGPVSSGATATAVGEERVFTSESMQGL